MSIHFNINQGRKKHEPVSITPSSKIDTKGFAVRQHAPPPESPPHMDNLDGMEGFANEDKLRPGFQGDDFDEPPPIDRFPRDREPDPYDDDGSVDSQGYLYEDEEEEERAPRMTAEQIKFAKLKVEDQFIRLKNRGVAVPDYSMSEDLDTLQRKLKTVNCRVGSERSIKWFKNGLIWMSSGAEIMNNKFDPFGLVLEGWSQQMHDDIDDYDDVLEELYYKHKDSVSMSPEVTLIMMIASSAFQFHMSNHMARAMAERAAPVYAQNNPEFMAALQGDAKRRMQTMRMESPEEDVEAMIREKTAGF